METFYRIVDTTTAWQIKDFLNDLIALDNDFKGLTYVFPSKRRDGLMVYTDVTVTPELEQKWEKFVKRVSRR